MSKCTVSLGHAMHVFLTLVCATLIVVGIHDFGCQLIGHGFAATLAGESYHILHRNPPPAE